MATKTCIIAWRWADLKMGIPNYINVKQTQHDDFKRQLIQFKEFETAQSIHAAPTHARDISLEAIKKEIKNYLNFEDDEVIVFLHKQTNRSGNGFVTHYGYTNAARHTILAMNPEGKQKIRCVLFGQNSFLYQKMLNVNGKFGVRESTNDTVTLMTAIYKDGLLDCLEFDLVWRHYIKEYVEYADHIKSLFKNCLNHWLKLPAFENDKKYPTLHWGKELAKNQDLYDNFYKFLKFSTDPDTTTQVNSFEERIYQKSIGIIVSNADAKQAYKDLRNIIAPPNDLKRQFSLRDIHQRMDKIRNRLV